MNLAEYFWRAVLRFPHHPALSDRTVRWTYRELADEVGRVAANLADRGVGPGDHILVILKNRRENVVSYWAAQWLGAIYTPINFRMTGSEILYCLNDCDPRLVIAEASLSAVLEEVLSQAATPVPVIFAGDGSADGFDALRRPGPNPPLYPAADDATAIMLYTSGTTGAPKGVPRSHLNESSAALAHIIQNGYRSLDSTIGVMPFYHTMGMRSLLAVTLLNGQMVLLPDYDTPELAAAIAEHGITTLYLVPTVYFGLVNLPDLDRYDFRQLKNIGYAGAAMTSSLTRLCFERLDPEIFVNHFGSSEIYTFTTCSWLDRKPTCAGRPGLHAAIRVVTADSEPTVGPEDTVTAGETGEVIVHLSSPEAFRGYWNRPDANAKALREGWYFTGDVGVIDDEGDLWVRGRVDDMVISGGENIHPLEIEDVLSQHPGVLEAAVAGLPDDRWGQVITAFVVPRDARLTAGELDRFCRESPQLARFKRPRHYVLVKAIPKSPVGKVLRRKLREGDYQPWSEQPEKRPEED
ncbi:MAG: class I adenylate-forming enzyme family protein [Thermaerobacter sp.]|nr:class I adenylate-forming enzyme family protein [Thermaerobacter sp.]